jgi:hypothetical protein
MCSKSRTQSFFSHRQTRQLRTQRFDLLSLRFSRRFDLKCPKKKFQSQLFDAKKRKESGEAKQFRLITKPGGSAWSKFALCVRVRECLWLLMARFAVFGNLLQEQEEEVRTVSRA